MDLEAEEEGTALDVDDIFSGSREQVCTLLRRHP
jgi:hypothetical protein